MLSVILLRLTYIAVDIWVYMEQIESRIHMRKFMQSVGDKTWKDLIAECKALDISVQELIRGHIIPAWFKNKDDHS